MEQEKLISSKPLFSFPVFFMGVRVPILVSPSQIFFMGVRVPILVSPSQN